MYSSRGLGQLSTLIQAITTQEGTCPSPSSCKYNNPGNLIYAGQPGATSGPGGFAVFDTYQDGYNALVNQLGLYAAGTCRACNGQPQTLASMFRFTLQQGRGTITRPSTRTMLPRRSASIRIRPSLQCSAARRLFPLNRSLEPIRLLDFRRSIFLPWVCRI